MTDPNLAKNKKFNPANPEPRPVRPGPRWAGLGLSKATGRESAEPFRVVVSGWRTHLWDDGAGRREARGLVTSRGGAGVGRWPEGALGRGARRRVP
jgi:hypothetical protein